MGALGILVVAIVMVVGLAGTVLPGVPGLPIVWLAALVYGLQAGFGSVGAVAFGLISVLAVVGVVASYALPARSVEARAAPRAVKIAGFAGAIIGAFVIPVAGLPIGAVAGVLIAEQRRTGDWDAAWRLTRALVLGFGKGALAEIAAGVAMIVAWVVWVLAG